MNQILPRRLIRIFAAIHLFLWVGGLTWAFASAQDVVTYQATNPSVNSNFTLSLTPDSLSSIKIQWNTRANIKSYTILRRYTLSGQSSGDNVDQTSGMDIVQVITEPSYYYYTDQAVDATQNNVYYQVKAEYTTASPTVEYSTIAYLENRINSTTSNTTADSSSQPICYRDGSCNITALEQSSDGGFDASSIWNTIWSAFSSSGSSTKYKSGQEVPSVGDVADMIETWDGIIGAQNIKSANEFQEMANSIYSSCSSDGNCTTDEVIEFFGIPPELSGQTNEAEQDEYKKSAEGQAALSAGQKLIGSSTSSSNGSSGSSSDDAASSANYVLDNFQGISVVSLDVFQCQSNTGIFCIIETVIKLALTLAGLIAVAFIVYGGYLYITSAGNPEGAKAGTTAVTNAAIGLIIILAAWLIVSTVLNVVSSGSVG